MADVIKIGDIVFSEEEQLGQVEQMITESRSQLLRLAVLDRVMVRKKLAGKLQTFEMNIDGQNRMQIAMIRDQIEHLEALKVLLRAEVDSKSEK